VSPSTAPSLAARRRVPWHHPPLATTPVRFPAPALLAGSPTAHRAGSWLNQALARLCRATRCFSNWLMPPVLSGPRSHSLSPLCATFVGRSCDVLNGNKWVRRRQASTGSASAGHRACRCSAMARAPAPFPVRARPHLGPRGPRLTTGAAVVLVGVLAGLLGWPGALRPTTAVEAAMHLGGPSTPGAPSQRAPSQRAPSQRAPSQRAPSQRAPSQRAQSLRSGHPRSGATSGVSVNLTPGNGPRVTPGSFIVTLRHRGSLLWGRLPAVELRDAQGNLRGWTLVIRAAGPRRLRVDPAPVAVLAGRPAEVHRGAPQALQDHPVVLAFAPRGGGDGSFLLGGTLVAPRSGQRPSAQVLVTLRARPGPP